MVDNLNEKFLSLFTKNINYDRVTISKKLFINIVKKKFRDNFKVIEEIGKGAFGRVFKVKHKISNAIYACKQIHKSQIVDNDTFNREIEVLIQMDHPNIIKLYEVYDDVKFVYLIMEECVGGELFDRIIEKVEKKTVFKENEAIIIFFQLM